MSKIALSPNASGTGVFTIASPNGNTDRTLTLPDEAGTVLTSASGLTAGNLTGSVPASAMPAGSVLQVSDVSAPASGTINASINYGNAVTLIRKSATSKFLIITTSSLYRPSTSGSTSVGYLLYVNGVQTDNRNTSGTHDDATWNTITGSYTWTDTGSVGDTILIYPRIDTSAAQNENFNYLKVYALEYQA